MFGKNEIVGQKYFKDVAADTLLVTSMFYTLQGEGPYAGQPCLFIRLAKCNLACSFCDTFFDAGDAMTFNQIEARAYSTICDYWNDRSMGVPLSVLPKTKGAHVTMPGGSRFECGLVITGGEPMLQANLMPFLERQVHNFKWVQIESNGTIGRENLPKEVTLVCSPKCAEREGKATQYLRPNPSMLRDAYCLKFVMSADPESPYHTIPEWAFAWREASGRDIFVSPMNVYNDIPHKAKLMRATKDEITLLERSTVDEVVSFWEPGLLNMDLNQKNHEYAARYALDNNLRLSLQTHLYASLA